MTTNTFNTTNITNNINTTYSKTSIYTFYTNEKKYKISFEENGNITLIENGKTIVLPIQVAKIINEIFNKEFNISITTPIVYRTPSFNKWDEITCKTCNTKNESSLFIND